MTKDEREKCLAELLFTAESDRYEMRRIITDRADLLNDIDAIVTELQEKCERMQPYYDAVRAAHPGYQQGEPPPSPEVAIRQLRQWSYEEGVESAQQEIERLREAAKAP